MAAAPIRGLRNLRVIFSLPGAADRDRHRRLPRDRGLEVVRLLLHRADHRHHHRLQPEPPLTEAGPRVQRFRDHRGRGTGVPGNRCAGIGIAGIRTPQVLWKASHGTGNRSSQESLHHLWRRTRGPQRGARTGQQTGAIRQSSTTIRVKMQKLDPTLAGRERRCHPGDRRCVPQGWNTRQVW